MELTVRASNLVRTQPVTLETFEEKAQELINSRVINGIELQVIRNELGAPKLKKMTPDGFYNRLIDIWSELKFVCGTIMYHPLSDQQKKALHPPIDELQIQLDVLQRFMLSNPQYMDLTGKEVVHAFYLNNNGTLAPFTKDGEPYKHYNQPLNAQFVGDVLNAYLRYKRKMYEKSHDAIKKLMRPKAPKARTVATTSELQAMIQEDYENYKAGELDMIFNATPKYTYLMKIGGIDLPSGRTTFFRYYHKAFEWRLAKARMNKDTDVVEEYEKSIDNHRITKGEHLYLIYLTRKLIYFRFFDMMIYFKVNNIFSEINP